MLNSTVLTKTVRRNAEIIAISFLVFLILFNLLLYYLLYYQLTDTLDDKLSHELEHVLTAIDTKGDSVLISRPDEFAESDFINKDENCFIFQLYRTNGTVIYRSENFKHFSFIPLEYPEFDGSELFTSIKVNSHSLRAAYAKVRNSTGKEIAIVQLSAQKIRLQRVLSRVFIYNVIVIPFVLIIIIATSIFISRRMIRPLRNIITTAEKISAFHLSERLEIGNDPQDELYKLTSTLNTLFERLEAQVKDIVSFTDNASHQLLSPLTIINSEIDYLLKGEQVDEETRQVLILLREQSNNMVVMIKTLLMIARSDRYAIGFANHVIAPDIIVQRCISQSYRNTKFTLHLTNGLYIRGTEQLFSIIVNNLIENAIKYSENDSKIEISIANNLGQVEIRIIDTGYGMTNLDKSRVFERFYRGSAAENSNISGFGLGLSLVKSLVTAMQGSIRLEDNPPKGTRVILTFPNILLEDIA